MAIDLETFLAEHVPIVLFLIVAIGHLLGRVRLGGMKLGTTSGVLIAALVFGHFGSEPPKYLQELGFIFFIYSVGLQAGPRFFDVFLKDGAHYVTLATVIAATGVALSWMLGAVFGLSPGHTAGILAGALTSTPTLAAAQDAITGHQFPIPDGMAATLVEQLTVGYAITYTFGLIGVLVLVKVLPKLLGLTLPEAAKEAAEALGIDDDEADVGPRMPVVLRVYEVERDEIAGKSLAASCFRDRTGCFVELLKRGDEVLSVDADTVLDLGDRVTVLGPPRAHRNLEDFVGREVTETALQTLPIETVEVIITQKAVMGRRLSELELGERYGCFVAGITRSGIDLPPQSDIAVRRGDQIHLTGVRPRLQDLVERLGVVDRDVVETDLLTFAVGIVAGLFVGAISFRAGNFSIGLGSAGGLLFAGIIVGRLRAMDPTIGRVPRPAAWVFTELGLLFFMTGVGLEAGGGFVEAMAANGALLIACGLVVTAGPIVVGYAFGRYVLEMNPAILLGSITGAMTSTPALGIVSKAANSSVPALGYAGTYTFANVLLGFAGALIMRL